LLSDQARDFVNSRGGTLFLRVRHNRCCSGGLTYLDASTNASDRENTYEQIRDGSPAVLLHNRGSVLPSTVSVEMRGRLKPHLIAYWDGCAFKL
jgi:hypothetical protein